MYERARPGAGGSASSRELAQTVEQEEEKPLLLDLHRALYFSSMGLAALFKLVKLAKERQRPVRFCNMDPYVRVLAEKVGLNLVVAIHDCEKSAIEAFAQA